MRAINVFLRNQELATEDKIALQLGEVIGVMEENIGKVTERGEKLHVLQDKIVDLKASSQVFKKKSKKVSRLERLKSLKSTLVLAGIIGIVLMILTAVVLTVVYVPK